MNPQSALRQLDKVYNDCLKHNHSDYSLFKLMENSLINWYYTPIKAPRQYLIDLIAQPNSKEINLYTSVDYCADFIHTFHNAFKAYKPSQTRSFDFSKTEAALSVLDDFLKSRHHSIHGDSGSSRIEIKTLYELHERHLFSEASLVQILIKDNPAQSRLTEQEDLGVELLNLTDASYSTLSSARSLK